MNKKLILSVIILINAIPIIYFFGMNRIFWWDETVYLSLGKSILKGRYEIFPKRDSFRPILIPFLITLGFIIDGEVITRILIFVFTVISIIATYYMGKKLFDVNIGLISALVITSFPLFIFNSNKILTEMMFITFTSLAITKFYSGIENERKNLYTSAFLTGISILTRYFGFFLLIIYLVYIIVRKQFKIFKKREFYIALLILFLTLMPWFVINMMYYRNPIGGILENAAIYVPLAKNQPLYFYIVNSWEIFGLSAIFIPLGIYYTVKIRKNNIILILICALLPFLIFSFMSHKEPRYLMSFFSAFSCLIAFCIQKIPNKFKTFTYGMLIIATIIGLYIGCKKIADEEIDLDVLKEGSLYIKEITHKNEYVMSESYPYLNYYAGRTAIRPASSKEKFYDLLDEYNISYVFIDYGELGNPDYLLDELRTTNFTEIKSFTDENQRTVKIYKKL